MFYFFDQNLSIIKRFTDPITGWNIYFKEFLSHNSWYLCQLLGFFVICWAFYFVRNYTRKLNFKSHRQELKRAPAAESQTLFTKQRMRSGADYANNKISRKVKGSLRKPIPTGGKVDLCKKLRLL